jgi:hypothetical protein
MLKLSVSMLVPIVALSVLQSCNKQENGGEGQTRTPSITQGETPASAAGISWRVPAKWTVGPARQMRVATYVVPPATEGAEGGECGVFYFGASEGGDVEANMSRWIGQFELSDDPKRTTRTVDGMTVQMIDLSGVYLASTGPMMSGAVTRKEGYRLLGAIIEGPQGSVFFKTTGPSAAIGAAEEDFNRLVSSFVRM